MEKETFNKLLSRLQSLKNRSSEIYVLMMSSDVNQMRVCDVTNLVQKARVLQGELHKVDHDELYHILSMSNLTTEQTTTFVKKFKDLQFYQPFIKALASYDVKSFPPLPKEVEYDCSVLGLKLKKQILYKHTGQE